MSGRYKINISAIYCSLANNEWYNEKTPDTAYFVEQFKERLKKYKMCIRDRYICWKCRLF